MNELTLKDNYDIEYQGFKLHSTGLEAIGKPTFEQWEDVGNFLKKSNKCVQFWIGDWLNYGENNFGEKYTQALDELDYTYGGLRNMSYVAEKVDLSRRHDNLSFSHHQEVAMLEPKEQEVLLSMAEEEGMSKSELRSEVKKLKRKQISENNKDKDLTLDFYNEDFRNNSLQDNSIDAIITDPPYPAEFIDLWQDLFYMASKKLKPSGFMVAYSGELNLDKIMKLDFGDMVYYWTFCLYHEGKTQLVLPRNVICRWKPVLIFQKPPFKKLDIVHQDYVISKEPEKDDHDWQQSESGVAHLIETFSNENDTVLDPFAGSGTFLKVLKDMNRKPIGYEIDNEVFNLAKGKL